MGTTSSTTMQSLREIEQRAPAVGAKIFCLFLSLSRSEFGALFCSRGHNFDRHSVTIYGSSWCGFQLFFRRDCSFRCAREFSLSSLGGATLSAKLRSKIATTPETGKKFVRTTSHNGMKKSAQRNANTARWLYYDGPKNFRPAADPHLGGAGPPKFNQLEMVTTDLVW